MVGTNIRGIRHLGRMVSDYSPHKILTKFADREYYICEVVRTKADSEMGEKIFIFNPRHHQSRHSIEEIYEFFYQRGIDIRKFKNRNAVEIDFDCINEGDSLFSEIVLLPDSFDNDFEGFLKENGKMLKNLSNKYGFDVHDITMQRIYIYTEGSKNFVQWAADLYYKGGCSLETIYNILLWNETYGQLTKNLSRGGTITAYTTSNSITELFNELSALRNEKRMNDAINSFNTAQKKLLRNNELSDNDKKALSKFAKLSETKRLNFIKKMSSVEDFNELMRNLKLVTSTHFEWNKKSFMDFIRNVEGINYELIYENDFVVLVKVNDYDTIKQLGKTTNWCISKNKSYWNNYITHKQGKSVQYMLFDFSKLEDDKLSIIGFTTTANKGITAAHNFVNDNIVGGEDNECLAIKSYLFAFNNNGNIYDILSKCGIDVTMIVQYNKPQYSWDADSLLSYLYECVDKNNVSILKNEDNKLVVSVMDEGIKYFFGESYFDNISSDYYDEQHIIFADFSKSQYDPKKLYYAIIVSGTEEDICVGMFNEYSRSIRTSFDGILSDFGMPYDTIRRCDNMERKIKSAFLSFDLNVIKESLKSDKDALHKVLLYDMESDEIFHTLTQSMVDYLSFDYLNLIYDSGHCLCDYLPPYKMSEIVKQLLGYIRNAARGLYRSDLTMERPSEERINAFKNEAINNRLDVMYIGYYLILKSILEHETSCENFPKFYCRIVNSIYAAHLQGGMIKELLYIMLKNVDLSNKNDTTLAFVMHFIKYGDDEMKDTITKFGERYSWVREVVEHETKSKTQRVATLASSTTELDSAFF